MAVPHFGHFIEVQGIPTTCLVFSPHFGQTQYPVGPAPIGPRCPPRPVPRPSTGPLPSGPVPSLPGILQNLPFKSYRLIASTGHSPTQAPHSIQSSLIVALLFSSLIAPTGHTSSHRPQPMHFSLSITAAIENHLLI